MIETSVMEELIYLIMVVRYKDDKDVLTWALQLIFLSGWTVFILKIV